MKFFITSDLIKIWFVCLLPKVGFYLYEFGVIARLDSEDSSGQNQQLGHNRDSRVRNLARRRNQEQAGTGDGHARPK